MDFDNYMISTLGQPGPRKRNCDESDPWFDHWASRSLHFQCYFTDLIELRSEVGRHTNLLIHENTGPRSEQFLDLQN